MYENVLSAITVNQHSSIRISAGKVLYVDPFRLENAPHDADVIFLTHDHFDHFSPEDIAKIARNDTLFVIPASMRGTLLKAGIDPQRTVPLTPGERTEVRGVPTEAVAAYNPSKKFHPKANGWLGYLLTVDGVRVYLAGDTDVTPEAEAVRCDVALLPIGGTYTMNAREAARLAETLAPEAVIPVHYGSIVGSPDDLKEFRPANIRVVVKL